MDWSEKKKQRALFFGWVSFDPRSEAEEEKKKNEPGIK